MADAEHLSGELLAVLHVKTKELVEVGEVYLVTAGNLGGMEDGDHFETLIDDVVAGVKLCRSVTVDCCVDSCVELANLDDVDRVGLVIVHAWCKGGNLHDVGEGAVVI